MVLSRRREQSKRLRVERALFGGGEGTQPSLMPLLRFEIQGIAFAAESRPAVYEIQQVLPQTA